MSVQFWLSPFWCLQANFCFNLRQLEFPLLHKYLLKAFSVPGLVLATGDKMASETLSRKHSAVMTSRHRDRFSRNLFNLCKLNRKPSFGITKWANQLQGTIPLIQILQREKAYYPAQSWRRSIVSLLHFLLRFPKGLKARFSFSISWIFVLEVWIQNGFTFCRTSLETWLVQAYVPNSFV